MTLDDLHARGVSIENMHSIKSDEFIISLRDANYGYTLLGLAVSLWDKPTVIRLVNDGHDLSAKNNDGDTILHLIAKSLSRTGKSDKHELVVMLMENGCDKTIKNTILT